MSRSFLAWCLISFFAAFSTLPSGRGAEGRDDISIRPFAAYLEVTGQRPELASGGNAGVLNLSVRDPHAMRDWMMNRSMANRLMQQYDDMVRDYDRRERFSQVSLQEQRAHVKRVSDFSRNVVGEVRSHHTSASLEHARVKALEDPLLREIAKPVVFLAAGYTYATGRSVSLYRGAFASFAASAHVLNRHASLGMSSPQLLNTSFLYAANSPDRYRLIANRSLPLIGAHGAVAYGVLTRSLTAAVSKSFTENISGQVDTTRTLGQSDHEETVRLNYAVTF